MNRRSLKFRVLIADAIAVASTLLAIFSDDLEFGWRLVLEIQFPLVFGAFWLHLARLQRPHYEGRLSSERI